MTREREEAIKHIENIIPYVGTNIKDALNMAIKALEQEQPKRGYWIDCYFYYKCSECKEIGFGSYRKICPNCKAKMEGVRNE